MAHFKYKYCSDTIIALHVSLFIPSGVKARRASISPSYAYGCIILGCNLGSYATWGIWPGSTMVLGVSMVEMMPNGTPGKTSRKITAQNSSIMDLGHAICNRELIWKIAPDMLQGHSRSWVPDCGKSSNIYVLVIMKPSKLSVKEDWSAIYHKMDIVHQRLELSRPEII